MNAPSPIYADSRESSDHYRGELCRLGRWRAIEGACGIQWVLQRHASVTGANGGRWEGRHYCQTREALIRLWTKLTGENAPIVLALQPERFGRRVSNGT
jgi:hypothetical protein